MTLEEIITRRLTELERRVAKLSTQEFSSAGGGTAAHAILSATHNDTVVNAVSRGSLIYGNSTPAWARLAKGTALAVLTGDGTDTAWSTYLISGTAGGTTNFAVTNTKTLTLTCAGDYNLTVPTTGTAALLGTANIFTATQTVKPAAGHAHIVSDGTTGNSAYFDYFINGTIKYSTGADATPQWWLYDNANAAFRILVNTAGARVYNGFGCNGKTPQAAYAVNAASTDLPTVIALCNQIRAALIADGICV